MHLTIHVTWNGWNIFAAGWRWVFVQYKIQNANEHWQYQLQNRLITTTLKEKNVGQLLFRRIYYIVYTFLPNNTRRTSNWQSVKELWRNHGLNIGFLLSCMQVRLDREAGRPRFLTDTNGKRKGKILQINDKKKERLGWREEKGRPRRFHCILNYHITTLLYCVRGTRTQPLICVGCSVHYWYPVQLIREVFSRLHSSSSSTHICLALRLLLTFCLTLTR